MTIARIGLGGLLVLGLAVSAGAQSRDITVQAMGTENRVALVIGNAAYASSPLRNPVQDARAMAENLRKLGFDVLLRQDLSEKATKRAIEEFGDRLRGGGVGLFFYAGHGLQVAGRNYLVPIDAQIRTDRDVDIEAVDVARVLARMEEARNRLNIVVLDACRLNPFGRSFRSATQGLAAIDAPSGTLIAYATSPGKVASDGDGQNGLYTGELLRAMREPGLRLEDVFKRVRQAVRTKTRGEQIPWEASSVEGDFFFVLTRATTMPSATAPATSEPEVTREVIREYGTLAIRGKLAGIEVWLDERRLGLTEEGTGLVLSRLAVGTYRIKGRKAGHKDWERTVQVTSNQRSEVMIDIEPLQMGPLKAERSEGNAGMTQAPTGKSRIEAPKQDSGRTEVLAMVTPSVAGQWQGEFSGSSVRGQLSLSLEQEGDVVTGILHCEPCVQQLERAAVRGVVTGRELSLTIQTTNGYLVGQLTSDALSGKVTIQNINSYVYVSTFTLARKK